MSNLRKLPHPRYLVGVIVAAVLISTTALVPPVAGCEQVRGIRISSSTEKVGLIEKLADRYNAEKRSVDGFCAEVEKVSGLTSGAMKNQLADEQETPPDAWLPTSSMWISMLGEQGDGQLIDDAATLGSVTASSLVIAMPESAITALEDSNQKMESWADLHEHARNGWSAYGKDKWGEFILGRDNPETSTSGLATTLGFYHAATNGKIDQNSVVDPEVVNFVREIESSVKPQRYGDEAVQFMETIYEEQKHQEARPYVDAVVVQEQMAYLYNKGAPSGNPADIDQAQPKDPLRAIYPNDGTIKLDHPYAVLTKDSAEQAVAKDFYKFLKQPEQQQRFIDIGFRHVDNPGAPTDELSDTLKTPEDKRLSFVAPPDHTVLDEMVGKWDSMRRKARVLLLLDMSRSMNHSVEDPTKGYDPTKLTLVRDAATDALKLLNPEDEVGLSTFSSQTREELAVGLLGKDNTVLTDAIQRLSAKGPSTELYEAVDRASTSMIEEYDPNRVNAIVLLTDGKDTNPSSGKLDGLLDKLDPSSREESVPIFTVRYGKEDTPSKVESDPLWKIADITNGTFYPATNVLKIGDVLSNVFRNFG